MAKGERSGFKKRFLFLVAVAAVLGLFTYVYNFLQSPAIGTVTNSVPTEEETGQDVPQAPLRLEGEYLTFSYPAVYGTARPTKPSNQIVEQYSFAARSDQQAESKRISIMVKRPFPGDDMTDDSAYQFRTNESAVYTPSNEKINNVSLKHFEKKDKSELTYFYPSSNYYAIISGTTTRDTGALAKDMKTVLESLSWQK